ncbi:hypothetical protein CHS0354_007410 [Potamilus streckersoni]|uniref:Fe2OG dioxygenase domain-containing protein n=1 Tax=Potamilus streckersoni TaxID=2493646 RepID=A0AAE0VZJ7_9BIVA|nr:hypothetical protein CHS0354_007410 [Potamilus streckersoni]
MVVEKGTSDTGTIEFEETDLKPLQFHEDPSFSSELITRQEVLDFRDEGFLLSNTLTAAECHFFIDEGEKLCFDQIYGVRDDYRSCKRITFQSTELAVTLWDRVKTHVQDIVIEGDPHKFHIHGIPFLLQGRWHPTGLNDIFRLCRYLPGNHFSPHFDGHYSKSPSERSLKTFMLYLNGDFSDGCTNFVHENQTLYKDELGRYCAEEKNILHSIKPETGLAIIFNHHRLHEGQAVRDGKKYILRSDIMYQNVDQKCSPEELQAILLLQKAETLENAGEGMKAADLYRRAFKLAPSLEKCT